jgi:hypothetical protein
MGFMNISLFSNHLNVTTLKVVPYMLSGYASILKPSYTRALQEPFPYRGTYMDSGGRFMAIFEKRLFDHKK